MFWAYIAFSQYLLIWYANIPEETVWFLVRQQGGWQFVGLLLIVGHFALPFFGLMSRRAAEIAERCVLVGVLACDALGRLVLARHAKCCLANQLLVGAD